ncbi:MAG: glucose 1-dehydrogenase [Bauldia sp.]
MPSSLFDLAGRIALVTGSSRGIGFAIAEGLAEAGAAVVLNARNPAELEAARARLAAAGHSVHALPFDVSDQPSVVAAVARIEDEIGPIDALFNNAGIQRRAPLADFDAQTWREIMAINLDAVFFVGQTVGRRMVARGRGKIVNTCSVGSEIARPTIAPYNTAKGAVKMLTKSMCAEWAPHGVQVNGIGPGYFKTELNRALHTDANFDAWVKARTPTGRWGHVDELKGVAVFLASAASSYVNGQIIYVDGGLLAVM